jgi:hypothetical protein
MFNSFFPEIRPVYVIMWRNMYGTAGRTAYANTAHERLHAG